MREGEEAPDFELPDQDGRNVRLSSLRGRRVVLYFYPAAMTAGCTAQACAIRDRRAELDSAGAVVLGVSPDPPKRLRKFADAHGLTFTLLADEAHEVANLYGTWVRRRSKLPIPRYGMERSTFVIGPDGRIERILRRVDPSEHDALVLRGLQAAPG